MVLCSIAQYSIVQQDMEEYYKGLNGMDDTDGIERMRHMGWDGIEWMRYYGNRIKRPFFFSMSPHTKKMTFYSAAVKYGIG